MREKLKVEQKEYLQLDKKAKEILSSGKDVKKLTNKELNTIIKSLRQKDDKGPLPTTKSDLIDLFERQKDRLSPVYEYGNNDESILVDNRNSNNEDCDVEITKEVIV